MTTAKISWSPFTTPVPDVDAPPIHHSYGMHQCSHPMPTQHNVTLRCGRLTGHTGRHATYGKDKVIAVWSDPVPSAQVPVFGTVTDCEKYERGFVTVTVPNGAKVRTQLDMVQVIP